MEYTFAKCKVNLCFHGLRTHHESQKISSFTQKISSVMNMVHQRSIIHQHKKMIILNVVFLSSLPHALLNKSKNSATPNQKLVSSKGLADNMTSDVLGQIYADIVHEGIGEYIVEF
jgi:hypothetical protein